MRLLLESYKKHIPLKIHSQWNNPSWIYFFSPFCLIFIIFSKFNIAKRDLRSKVWVVGNACVGGTGKTSIVLAIAKWLESRNVSYVIMLRGYKGKAKKPLWVLNDHKVELVGDEALMLKNSCKGSVIVCSDRCQAIKQINLKMPDVKVILSDDGLQHRKLKYKHAILLKSYQRNKFLLPIGPMRTNEVKLSKLADFVLEKTKLLSNIEGFLDYENKFHKTLDSKAINAVTAVGNPNSFFSELEELGYDVKKRILPDHYFFMKEDVVFNNSNPVVMTAKDAVKVDRSWLRYYIAQQKVTLPKDLIDLMEKWLD